MTECPPLVVAEPTSTEAPVHDPIVEEIPEIDMEEKIPSPPASPPRANPGNTLAGSPLTTAKPTQKSLEKSPGSGFGTNYEVQYLGTQTTTADAPPNVVAKIMEPEVKVEASTYGKEPIIYSERPALEDMDLSALISEYFSRLSQHKGLEAELVTTIQKRHQVTLLSPLLPNPQPPSLFNLFNKLDALIRIVKID